MTILANELRINQSITNVTLIQMADRRITRGGKFDSNRRKVFEIPYLKASVGYFGLAQPTSREYFFLGCQMLSDMVIILRLLRNFRSI
jgi:hypothetical protein